MQRAEQGQRGHSLCNKGHATRAESRPSEAAVTGDIAQPNQDPVPLSHWSAS